MSAPDHNTLLKRIARERFAPHGIVQQGGSRIFLKDRDWFTVMIEFQPGSFAKGSYLNVGADLHFFPRDHMAFSYGYREEGFTDATDPDFAGMIGKYCDRALERVQEIERDFASYGSAIRALGRTEQGDWGRYQLGFLHALAGHTLRARWHLGRVAAQKAEYDFERERVRMAREVISHLGAPDLGDHLQRVIHTARGMKGLPHTPVGLDPR